MENNSKKRFNDVLITVLVANETRKPAFGSFNRDVNFKHVEIIAGNMKIKGYRNGELIQVLKAEEAAQHGITELVDMNGNLIPEDQYKDCYLVLEGQSRTYAASLYNDWLTEKGQPTIAIPAIEIELQPGESVAEYCADKNSTIFIWGGQDYANCAAHLLPNEPLLQRYNELAKSPSNPLGMGLSTLNLIFCPARGIAKTDFIKLCAGQSDKLTRGKVRIPIIPTGCNIEVGDKFISICKKVGFNESEIGKRYLITEFNNLRNAQNAEFGFKVFESITEADIMAMTNKNKKLIEQNVIDHFQIMIKRVYKNTPAAAQSAKH